MADIGGEPSAVETFFDFTFCLILRKYVLKTLVYVFHSSDEGSKFLNGRLPDIKKFHIVYSITYLWLGFLTTSEFDMKSEYKN